MRLITAVAASLLITACTSTSTGAVHQASPSPSAVETSPPSKFSPLPTIPVQETIEGMRMTSLSVIWAATDTRVLRSTDAGRTWSDVTPPDRPGRWSAFFALDDSAAWVASSLDRAPTFTVMRTVDGGRTWQGSTGPMSGIGPTVLDFVDRRDGWVLVDGGVAAGSQAVSIDRTTDGGATWKVVAFTEDPSTGAPGRSGLQFSCDKGAFAFGSTLIGLLPTACATNQQSAYRTIDGGLHWSAVDLPPLTGVYQAFFAAPIFLTPSDVVISGSAELVSSHDGGASWTVHRLPGDGSVDFDTPTSGWQLNETSISATSDGGSSWHVVASSLPFNGSGMALQYLGKGIAIAFWWHGTSAYRTADGGRTWRSITPGGLSS